MVGIICSGFGLSLRQEGISALLTRPAFHAHSYLILKDGGEPLSSCNPLAKAISKVLSLVFQDLHSIVMRDGNIVSQVGFMYDLGGRCVE